MNILILSCGTRNKLVEYFKKCSMYDKVVVTDCSENAPALYGADAYYIVPRMTEKGYIDVLLSICQKEQIKVLLPLQEDELLLISENKQIFEDAGVYPVISDYDKIVLCKDKYALNNFLAEKGMPAVPTFPAREYAKKTETSETAFPVFVKPRFGAGSVDTFCVKSKEMLNALIGEEEEELIVQPKALGEEYGIDLYVDFISKKAVQVFVKKKIRMRAGETEKSVSVVSPKLSAFAAKVAQTIGLTGPVDMDVFADGDSYHVLEVNPRFGGGYPHARECGMDVPALIANNADGKENTESLVYADGVVAMRYSEIVIR